MWREDDARIEAWCFAILSICESCIADTITGPRRQNLRCAAKLTQSLLTLMLPMRCDQCDLLDAMPLLISLVLSTLVSFVLATAPLPRAAMAQTGEAKEKSDPDRAKDAQRRKDEFAEATKMLQGAAGQAECVWLGRRVVGLLWRDDLDTAMRHMEFYDRFGCPGGHIQSAFRCVVRQGAIDAKAPESLAARAHACWIDPKMSAEPTATISPGGEATK